MNICKNMFLVLIVFSTSIYANTLTNTLKVVKLMNKSQKFKAKDISQLSKVLDETKGSKKLGQVLGKMRLENEILEDVFMRLAIYRKKISVKEGNEMFINLSSSKGFRTTLKKVIGNNPKKTSGHLNELRIANQASKNGFKVKSIGEKFSDGIKKSPTDVDILLQRKGKVFAIEAKDYKPNTNIPIDKFRGDMDTLVSYRKNHGENVIPVFSMTKKPNNIKKVKMLENISEKRGVYLIYGNTTEQIQQIRMLGDIL